MLPRFVSLGLLLLMLVACGRISPTPLQRDASGADADIPALLAQRDQAVERARMAAAHVILHQIDVDPTGTRFRFTDGDATLEITVFAPQADTPVSQWDVLTNTASPLVGHAAPALTLHEVLVGPAQVTDALFQQWPECREPSATLFLNAGTLTW